VKCHVSGTYCNAIFMCIKFVSGYVATTPHVSIKKSCLCTFLKLKWKNKTIIGWYIFCDIYSH